MIKALTGQTPLFFTELEKLDCQPVINKIFDIPKELGITSKCFNSQLPIWNALYKLDREYFDKK